MAGHVDAALLALADDDESESEIQDTKPTSAESRSPSPLRSPPSASKPTPPPRGVTQKKAMKSSRGMAARRRRDDDADDAEGSAAESLGSGAMSESESDLDISSPTAADDGPLFPVDGRFKDETERVRVLAMPEVEREQFLADRSEELQQAAQSAQLRRLMASRARQDDRQKKRKADTDDLGGSPRKRTTAKSKTSEKLAAYKRQREERHEQRTRVDDRRNRGERSASRDEERHPLRDAEGDSDVEWDEPASRAPARRDEPTGALKDFERTKIGRGNFSIVCYYPGFEDAMKGSFCRVCIGQNRDTRENLYRMTQIKGFTEGREYEMEAPLSNGGTRKFRTKQMVVLAHGKAEKEWPFTQCSNAPLTQAEFDRYMDVLATDNLRPPPLSYLVQKCKDIQGLIDHRWTSEEITERLRRQGWLPGQHQSSSENLIPLDEATPAVTRPTPANNGVTKVPTQQERLAALNRANRKANADEVRKAQIEERKRNLALQKRLAEGGDAVANPFARVKTKTRVHYDARGIDGNKLNVPKSGGLDDLFGEGTGDEASRAGTPKPEGKENGAATGIANGPGLKAAAAGAMKKKKVMDDDILASMDLGIDIEI